MKRSGLILMLVLLGLRGYAQNHKIDSLRNALAGEKEDTNRVNTLNHLSDAFVHVSRFDSVIFYANKAKEIADKIGFERNLSSTYCNLANAYCYLGNKLKAIEYANKALGISRKYNNARFTAYALNLLGLTYMGVQDYSKAIDAYSSGISICRKSGDKRNLCAMLANIATIYSRQSNSAKALEFDTLALATAREINYTEAIYALQNNIGVIYSDMKNYSKAKEYCELALTTSKKLGDPLDKYNYNSNIADIYSAEGNYPKALECKYTALLTIKEVGKKNDIAKAYGDVGEVYFFMKNYTAAKPYFDSALAISKSIGELEITKGTYRFLYLLDSIKGDIRTGLEDYKKYVYYRDSVANQVNGQKAAQAEMNYNFARKMDSAQAAQDKLNVIADNEKGRQKVIEYALGGGLTLAFFASCIFFFQRRRISKERQKLKESNEVKDKLFSIISHDLRSPLNLLSSMMGLFKRGKITHENSEILSQNLESSMQNTMSLLDNLLSWSHSQMKGFNIKSERLKLDEVAVDVVNLYSNSAKQKGITIESDLPAGIELDADKNVIKLVIRNLLNNAIKFSNQGGRIVISTFNKNGQSGFSVKDNGIGIPKASLHNLFKLGDTKKNREGTNEEQGSGLGLVLCEELITRCGGKLQVESEEGKGTTISALFHKENSSMPY